MWLPGFYLHKVVFYAQRTMLKSGLTGVGRDQPVMYLKMCQACKLNLKGLSEQFLLFPVLICGYREFLTRI